MKGLEIAQRLGEISSWRALVIGDVMLDDYTFCETANSKEIPSEKFGKRAYQTIRRVTAPGGAGNAAVNLRQLGAVTSLIGVVGVDGYDTALRRECELFGISTTLLPDRSRPTTTKRRVYVDDEYFFRIDNELSEPIAEELAQRLLAEFTERVDEIDVVVLSDYNKGLFTPSLARDICTACTRRGIPLVVDCKPPNISLFKGATIIIPNLIEAKALDPSFSIDESLPARIRALFSRLESKLVAVTLGSKGICGFDGSEVSWIKGIEVVARDTVGAGDTVRASVAMGLVLGLPFPDCLRLANATGALVVQKMGTSFVTKDELMQFLPEVYPVIDQVEIERSLPQNKKGEVSQSSLSRVASPELRVQSVHHKD